MRRATITAVTSVPASATTLTRTPSALRTAIVASVTEPEQPDQQRDEQREGNVRQQWGDNVFVDTDDREDLPDDDGGDDPDHGTQHPGRKVGAEQVQRRRVTAPRNRQHGRRPPQGWRRATAATA